MPKLKFSHVVSFSSEDAVHRADNLLADSGSRKWRTAGEGEAAAAVVLQLDRAARIHAVDVGNDGAAFVEVQVARSTAAAAEADDAFKTLLASSSFMSPLEARNGQNGSRVRFFAKDKLNQDVVNDKWDRVKIVCTQPFNKHVKYGLSFISLASPSTDSQPTPKPTEVSPTKLGAFTLKDEDEEETGNVKMPAGSLFARAAGESKRLATAAAELRSDTTLASLALGQSPMAGERPMFYQLQNSKRQREGDRRKTKDERQAKLPRRDVLPGEKERKEKQKKKEEVRTPKRETNQKRKPFNKLLEGVVFAISGYQNPQRGQIRQKALEMGAKYKPDWIDGVCTHLVCAFANTPKFQKVKTAGGKIVTGEWIEKCHAGRKRFPWRRHCLDRADKKKPESEEEIWEEEAEKQNEFEDTDDEIEAVAKANQTSENEAKIKVENKTNIENKSEFDKDTDDEIEDVRETSTDSDEAYNADTDIDDEVPTKVKKELPVLPEFFAAKSFFFRGDFSPGEIKDLKRRIVAAGGSVAEYMGDHVTYVVTDKWRGEFNQVKRSDLTFVNARYVRDCWKAGKRLSKTDYIIRRS